jgi:hypothetical protein
LNGTYDFEIRVFESPIQIFIFQNIRAKAGKSGVSGYREFFKKNIGNSGRICSPGLSPDSKKYLLKTGKN